MTGQDAAPGAGGEPLAPGLLEGAPLADADVLAGRAPPTWQVGDWWRFRDLDGASFEVVVVDAGPAGYRTMVTAPRNAAYDALSDISYVGRVTRDIAGEQHGTPVTFFRWPLANGTTWTTTWDGREVELTATASPAVPVPRGTAEGFEIVGIAGGRPYVAYSYAPSLGFWSRISFDNGTFALELTDRGASFAGNVFEGEARELGRAESGAGPALAPYWEFTVEDEPILLRVSLTAEAAAPGVARLEIAGPGGDDASAQTICASSIGCEVALSIELAPRAGVGKVIEASTMPGEHAVVALAGYATAVPFTTPT